MYRLFSWVVARKAPADELKYLNQEISKPTFKKCWNQHLGNGEITNIWEMLEPTFRKWWNQYSISKYWFHWLQNVDLHILKIGV